MSPPVIRRHDQSYKLLFALPVAVQSMIRRYVSRELADELDFDRMEALATERVTTKKIRSQADLMWRIHFKGSARYLLLSIEFQSWPDRYMAVRTLYYVAIAYHGLVGQKVRRRLGPGGQLPPTLAVTVYNGPRRWTPPDDVYDLIEPVRGWLAGRQPKLQYEVLDLRVLADQDPKGRDVVSWIASMESDPSRDNVLRVVRKVREAYPGPEHARLREAFREWILGAAELWRIGEEVLAEVKTMEEAEMVYHAIEEEKERYRREERGRGRTEGGATMACRLARLKFGAETAERLSQLLEGITDPKRIARIGEGILECETGAELLARARDVSLGEQPAN
jgi:hypothetical protein